MKNIFMQCLLLKVIHCPLTNDMSCNVLVIDDTFPKITYILLCCMMHSPTPKILQLNNSKEKKKLKRNS